MQKYKSYPNHNHNSNRNPRPPSPKSINLSLCGIRTLKPKSSPEPNNVPKPSLGPSTFHYSPSLALTINLGAMTSLSLTLSPNDKPSPKPKPKPNPNFKADMQKMEGWSILGAMLEMDDTWGRPAGVEEAP